MATQPGSAASSEKGPTFTITGLRTGVTYAPILMTNDTRPVPAPEGAESLPKAIPANEWLRLAGEVPAAGGLVWWEVRFEGTDTPYCFCRDGQGVVVSDASGGFTALIPPARQGERLATVSISWQDVTVAGTFAVQGALGVDPREIHVLPERGWVTVDASLSSPGELYAQLSVDPRYDSPDGGPRGFFDDVAIAMGSRSYALYDFGLGTSPDVPRVATRGIHAGVSDGVPLVIGGPVPEIVWAAANSTMSASITFGWSPHRAPASDGLVLFSTNGALRARVVAAGAYSVHEVSPTRGVDVVTDAGSVQVGRAALAVDAPNATLGFAMVQGNTEGATTASVEHGGADLTMRPSGAPPLAAAMGAGACSGDWSMSVRRGVSAGMGIATGVLALADDYAPSAFLRSTLGDPVGCTMQLL
jgi:hypothetical protein